MQQVLSIDTTSEPAHISVFRVDGRKLEVLEQKSLPQSELGFQYHEEPAASSSEDTEKQAEQSQPRVTGLKDVLSSFKESWTNSIIIVPPWKYFSLNVELPFGDVRSIDRILDLEVQDHVPFDVSEFLLQAQPVHRLENGRYDVHVSLVPKNYVQEIIELCKESGIEPRIVSTPASVLGALYYLAPQYFPRNSAVIFPQQDTTHMIVAIDGKVRADRVLHAPFPAQYLAEEKDKASNLLTEMKLTITATEQAYNKALDKVIVVGNEFNPKAIQELIGREVETVEFEEILGVSSLNGAALSGLASVFVQDEAPPPILTNLRAREFSYRLQLGELFRGLKRLIPYVLAAFSVLVIGLVFIYFLNIQKMNSMRSAMREQIQRIIGDETVPDKDAIFFLRGKIKSLNEQVKDLGTPAKLSPLAALLEISKDMPKAGDIKVKRLSIEGTKMRIEGTTPDYSGAEQLEGKLKKNRKMYCNVKLKPPGAGAGGTKTFNFEIELCK